MCSELDLNLNIVDFIKNKLNDKKQRSSSCLYMSPDKSQMMINLFNLPMIYSG